MWIFFDTERSPDKKIGSLSHASSTTSLSSSDRSIRPLPPTPEKQSSYYDRPWFHNLTREQANILIEERKFRLFLINLIDSSSIFIVILLFYEILCDQKKMGMQYLKLYFCSERTYGNVSDGYFLMRPSTSNPNNPLTLVLWCKDRIYNVPVRRRPDNR